MNKIKKGFKIIIITTIILLIVVIAFISPITKHLIEKYDKNLIDAALFHPYIWIIEITENSFNVVKLRGITEEYENELRQLSPLAAPPPIKPVIKFVPPKKHR